MCQYILCTSHMHVEISYHSCSYFLGVAYSYHSCGNITRPQLSCLSLCTDRAINNTLVKDLLLDREKK